MLFTGSRDEYVGILMTTIVLCACVIHRDHFPLVLPAKDGRTDERERERDRERERNKEIKKARKQVNERSRSGSKEGVDVCKTTLQVCVHEAVRHCIHIAEHQSEQRVCLAKATFSRTPTGVLLTRVFLFLELCLVTLGNVPRYRDHSWSDMEVRV